MTGKTDCGYPVQKAIEDTLDEFSMGIPAKIGQELSKVFVFPATPVDGKAYNLVYNATNETYVLTAVAP